MKEYDFTIVLDVEDINDDNLADILFEAGCDDALLHLQNGIVALDFTRKAESLEEAILSATTNIELTGIRIKK